MRTILAGVAVLLAWPVVAQETPTIIAVSGSCERLVYDGSDHTRECPDTLLQMVYENGRVGFYAATDEVIVTFSGFDGAKPDEDTQLHTIDSIIVGRSGSEPRRREASGICSYANPYRGPVTISCQGAADDGAAFLMVFRTDGSEPEIIGQ